MVNTRLEVETESGRWVPVDVVVGLPAGKTKTIVCDLTGKLPVPAGRLRLTTTYAVRWDRIALFERQPLPDDRVHRIAPRGAELYRKGFPDMRRRAAGHPITPDYTRVHETPPWRTTPQGWCTRYGDVLDLVAERDGKLAILNGGDAVTLSFPADALPPVPGGMARSFFFLSAGWEKDGDHNVENGDTVEPFPVTDSKRAAWSLEYNTRFVPGGAFGPKR